MFGDGRTLVAALEQHFQLANHLLWVFDIQPRKEVKANAFMT
jgi:hypothetical protein